MTSAPSPLAPADPIVAERAAARSRARLLLRWHPWPAELLDLLARMRAGGAQAYLVGGTVRDVVLGREPRSPFDVATDLEPAEVVRRFQRVEPIGLKHGTVLIIEPGLSVESTTMRREGAYLDARHPDGVEYTRDPLEDLARRDLTVNALAYDPDSAALLDPHGGALDLERRVLRAVGDPVARFREDALRPLRVARFAVTLGMEPEPGTRAALGAMRDRAPLVAWERVREELEKMMAGPTPSTGWELLRESGLLDLWLPELIEGIGVTQNRYHAYDVYEHSIRTCDEAPPGKSRVRWAALLHDVGKPRTRVERGGEGTFYNHQFVGAEMADPALERLRFPLEERRAIVHLVREHMFDYKPKWSDAALRRWLKRVGVEAVADLFDLRIADYLGNGLRRGFPSYLDEMRARIERMIRESHTLEVRDLEVDGHDVMRVLGAAPGPEVGAALERLLEEVLDDPSSNRRERLVERLEEWRRERESSGALEGRKA